MLFGGRAAFFPETKQTIRQSAEILRRGMIQVFPSYVTQALSMSGEARSILPSTSCRTLGNWTESISP